MRLIGITGGVGAGKSTVLAILKEISNCIIIMADDVAKEMMQLNGILSADAIRIFGEEAYLPDGTLNTPHIATLMYSRPELKEEWTGIVHPRVRQTVLDIITDARSKSEYDFFFFEAALLLEEGYDSVCDEVWYIYVDEEERIKRLVANRGYSESKCRSIMKNQLTHEEFIKKTNFVIDNGVDIKYTRKQLENKLEEYRII